MWAADSRGQLTELYKHLKMNPFIKRFKPSLQLQAVYLLDDTCIHTVCLNEDAFLGKHVLTLFLDEIARMDTNLITEIRGCLLKGGKEIFLSTPVKGSFFEDLCGIYHTVVVGYKECSEWIDGAKIEWEMDHFPSLKQLYLREYCNVFTALDGAVFPHIIEISPKEMAEMAVKCETFWQGMDLNTAPGHVGIRIALVEEKWLIADCQVFPYGLQYQNLKAWVKMYPSEVESGGANTAFIKEIGFSDLQGIKLQPVAAEFWFNRISVALMHPIYVIKGSDIAKDLYSVQFKKGKLDMNPHHWCAAFLHAIGMSGGPRYLESIGESEILRKERLREREYQRSRQQNQKLY